MEYIKKTVYRIMTTGTTTGATNCKGTYPQCTGCTGHCVVLIPNTGVSYCFRILLTQPAQDIGFFNAYLTDTPYQYIQLSGATPAITKLNLKKFEQVLSGGTTLAASGLLISGDTGFIIGAPIPNTTYHVTGGSSSRLIELRKYTVTNIFTQQYISGGTIHTDGVDYAQSTTGVKVVYYIGGIKYVDLLTGFTSGTTFSFITSGMTNNPNFINKPIYKDMNKENIISNPEIADDVFIVRQEISAFDKNYRLEYITNLVDLETYAGGAFFNIVNNT